MGIIKFIIIFLFVNYWQWTLSIFAIIVMAYIIFIYLDNRKFTKLTDEEKKNEKCIRLVYDKTGLFLRKLIILDISREYMGFDYIHSYKIVINEPFDESKLLIVKQDIKEHFSITKLNDREYMVTYAKL